MELGAGAFKVGAAKRSSPLRDSSPAIIWKCFECGAPAAGAPLHDSFGRRITARNDRLSRKYHFARIRRAQTNRRVAETLQFDDRSIFNSRAEPPARQRAPYFTHHNILNNGFFSGECLRSAKWTGCASLCRLPLLRNGAVRNLTCMTHGATMAFRRGIRRSRVLETVERNAARLARCSHDVYRRTGASGIARFDLTFIRTGIMARALPR